jgi:hypothetical protein
MTFAENVVACFERATAEDMREGMSWYPTAHEFACSLDSDVWRAAGVIAAMSVQKQWTVNMMLARRAYETGTVSGNFGTMNAQGQRILDGEHPLDVLGGDKVRAFCTAIATAGQSDDIVVDRHAHDIAMGRVFTDATRKITKRIYRTMAAHYTEAAREVGVSGTELQAVTWTTWRREKGLT